MDVLSQEISELHFAVHNQKRDSAYWRWCYFTSPIGKSSLIVALRAGQVVGKYGLLYLPLIVKGKPVVVSLMSSISIHPRERSWHSYRGLVEKYFSESQKDNYDFWLGVSFPQTMRLNRQMGLVSLGKIPIYFGYLDISRILEGRFVPYPLSLIGRLLQPFAALRVEKEELGNLEIWPIDDFDSTFDEFWSAISANRIVSVVKNAAYLNWRYVKCPGNRYRRLAVYRNKRLEGFVIFCTIGLRYGSCILELLARDDNPEIIRALLLRVFQELRKQKIGCIIASFPAKSPAAAVLQGLGFKLWGVESWPTHVIIAANPAKEGRLDLDLKDCEFSLGDWNIV